MSRKIRVLLVSHTCQSASEGQPKAHEIARHADIDLQVLVPDRWQHYGAPRAPQIPQNPGFAFRVGKVALPWVKGAGFYLHFYPQFAQALREFSPDIIDLWEEPWGLVSAHACALRAKHCPRAKIITETEQNIFKKLPPPFENFRSYTLQKANFAVGRNTQSLEILRRKGFSGPSRVVPNGVDTSLFLPRQVTDSSEFVVGYSGRLVEEKGLDELLEALDFLPQNVILHLVGGGDYELKLREKAAKLGRRVQFVGAQPLEKLPKIYARFDVLVLPSRTTKSWKEQFGRVLIEAGSCGVPVVGSNSGAIPEVIGALPNGDENLAKAQGLVFPEGDARALAAQIARLQNDPILARKLGQNGISRAKDEFSWACVAAQMTQIYRELAA